MEVGWRPQLNFISFHLLLFYILSFISEIQKTPYDEKYFEPTTILFRRDVGCLLFRRRGRWLVSCWRLGFGHVSIFEALISTTFWDKYGILTRHNKPLSMLKEPFPNNG